MAKEVDEETAAADSDGFCVVTAGSEGGGFIEAVRFNGPSSFFMISYLICFALSIVFASTRAQEKTSCISSSIVVELEVWSLVPVVDVSLFSARDCKNSAWFERSFLSRERARNCEIDLVTCGDTVNHKRKTTTDELSDYDDVSINRNSQKIVIRAFCHYSAGCNQVFGRLGIFVWKEICSRLYRPGFLYHLLPFLIYGLK